MSILHQNCDGGVRTARRHIVCQRAAADKECDPSRVNPMYLAVSEKLQFFDLSLGADCIGVLARGSVFEIQVFHSFRTDLCTFLNLVSSRLYRCFAESPLFATFVTCDSRFLPRCTG